MKTTTKIITLVLIAAFGVFAGFRIYEAWQKKEAVENAGAARKGSSGGRVVSVSVTEARAGSVRQEIEITGALKPKEQVDVTAKVTGRVDQISVQVGDFVREGQAIAVLDDAELAQQVRRADAARQIVRATQAQREAELGTAKASAERARQLFEGGLISRQEYETSTTAVSVLQAQMALAEAQEDQAEAELRGLKIQQSQMRIVAPISGYVAQRFVDVGAMIGPATPIARVVNLSTMVTLANVPERGIASLRVGNRAVVSVDAFGDQDFTGKVARIAPVLDASTRTALVEVEIPNPQGALKAEMFARVKLDLGAMREAVLIPRDSLVYRGAQPGVYVVQSDRPTFRSVETGTTFGQDVEVLTNLEAGTRIVGRGAAMLAEGDRIKVVEEKEAERLHNTLDERARAQSAS